MDKYELAIRQDKISAGKNNAKDLTIIIGGIYAQAGKGIEATELVSISNALFRDLQTRFSTLSLQEVGIAMDNGLRGDYGQFYGLSVLTFNNWLKAYKQSDERFKAIKQMENAKVALPPPSAEYNEQKMKEISLRYFESYKKTGDPGIACVAVYTFLQNTKVINQSKECKLQAMDMARKKIGQPKGLPSTIDLLENRIKCEAIKLCLIGFFQELINKNLELKDVMK